MSANTERFLQGAQAFTPGDPAAVVEFIDEEIEFELAYDDVRDLGDGKVLALGTIRIRGRGSGVETDVPTAVIATIRDGRMTHFRDYGDHDAALAAAGLA
jgi:hypothetical protein